MISRLRGTIAAKLIDRIVLDVQGVGYEILITPAVLTELPEVGEEAVIHTHLHVREDQLTMFGFSTDSERSCFRILLGVSGVGPKLALTILGTMSSNELSAAVVAEDADALTAVPGIGKRSAQKLMLELRPKLELPDAELLSLNSVTAEVRHALEGLGYQMEEIRGVTDSLPEDASVEETLRMCLRELGRQSRA